MGVSGRLYFAIAGRWHTGKEVVSWERKVELKGKKQILRLRRRMTTRKASAKATATAKAKCGDLSTAAKNATFDRDDECLGWV
jgi:hypothetical protein